MLRILLAVVALVVFVKCARRFGLRNATLYLCLLIVGAYPFSLSAGILLPFLRKIWAAWPLNTRIGVILAAVVFSSVLRV
jgi:hypothetical protein